MDVQVGNPMTDDGEIHAFSTEDFERLAQSGHPLTYGGSLIIGQFGEPRGVTAWGQHHVPEVHVFRWRRPRR